MNGKDKRDKKDKKQKKTKYLKKNNIDSFVTNNSNNNNKNTGISSNSSTSFKTPNKPTLKSIILPSLANVPLEKNPSSITSLNAAHESDTTISGLDTHTSAWIINILSILIGIFVFYFVPLLTNNLNRPLTAVLLNIIPNGLIMGFFIVEAEFTPYLTNLIWTPLLNVLANCISYILIFYFEWSATSALAVNIFIWVFAIFLSLYI